MLKEPVSLLGQARDLIEIVALDGRQHEPGDVPEP
jgi:hypothetical protein